VRRKILKEVPKYDIVLSDETLTVSEVLPMNSITQDVRYKQSVIKYSFKHGVTKAAIKHKQHRKTIYRWIEKYDGTLESLKDKSRRPNSHPNQHTEEEIKLIKDMKKKNKETGLFVFWVKLKRRGYTRRIESLYRVMVRHEIYERVTVKKKYVPQKYEEMKYPGQRVQIDIKYVPKDRVTGRKSYYQYTALDEYSRQRYIQVYEEKSTYTSVVFLEEVEKYFKYKIECVQTDNGMEFTNRLTTWRDKKTLFEKVLIAKGIKHKYIKPYTPRHNGKVERSHRKDKEWFYNKKRFYDIEDLKSQLRRYMRWYNNFPMRPLQYRSPNEVLKAYWFQESVTYV